MRIYSVFFIALAFFGLSLNTYAGNFTDDSGHLNEEAIDYLFEEGVVVGYSDGRFGVNDTINRAEFLKILLLSSGIELSDLNGCFPDVQQDWFARYVCSAKAKNIIDGYPDGFFRPDNEVNLAEALKMVLETYFTDVDFYAAGYANWYEGYFWYAKPNGLLSKIREDVRNPITRGEMAQLIYNIHLFIEDDSVNPEPDPEPTGPLGCYVSDSLKTYAFAYEEEASSYPILVDDIDNEADCRDYAISKYSSDSTITRSIEVGDIIDLANNISVKITKIEFNRNSYNDIVRVSAEHYLDGKQLSTGSYTHVMYYESDDTMNWNENFGYRITLVSLDDDNNFEVEFTPLTPYINSPYDLYRDCYFNLGSSNSCYHFSLNDPLPGEIEINYGDFVLYGPEEAEEYIEGIGKQLTNCYSEVVDFTGIESDFEKIPVHFLVGDQSGVVVTNQYGIKWPYFGSNTDIYEGSNECKNNTVAHELVHIVVRDTPLSDILNEGLATYVSHEIVNDDQFSCEETGYNLYGEFHEYGDINAYSQIPYREGGSELYWTSACFWEEYSNDFGISYFLQAMQVLADNRNYEQSGSTVDLIENELGVDITPYREKYGFDTTTEDYPAQGIAERYTIWGGSIGTRWDGNYE